MIDYQGPVVPYDLKLAHMKAKTSVCETTVGEEVVKCVASNDNQAIRTTCPPFPNGQCVVLLRGGIINCWAKLLSPVIYLLKKWLHISLHPIDLYFPLHQSKTFIPFTRSTKRPLVDPPEPVESILLVNRFSSLRCLSSGNCSDAICGVSPRRPSRSTKRGLRQGLFPGSKH